jgi:two-component system invasion response regulator UvrY
MNILLVDDHAVVRQGVVRLLAAIPDAEFREAETPEEAEARYRERRPDVMVLDINLRGGSGLDLLRRIRAEDPGARVVIFSMYTDAVYANSARRAGAIGYVSKSAPADELLTAVRRAARGESFVDSLLSAELGTVAASPDADPLRSLSRREIEVLRLLGDGKGLTDIAAALGVAYKTVANTCTRVKEKLGVERTGDLIRFAVENRHNKLSQVDLDAQERRD